MKEILPEVRVSRMGIRKKMLLMYVAVIFTMTVVTAVPNMLLTLVRKNFLCTLKIPVLSK